MKYCSQLPLYVSKRISVCVLVFLGVCVTNVIHWVPFRANLCVFCKFSVNVVSCCRGTENLLSNGNLSSFGGMAIHTYTATDQSVCWYVACVCGNWGSITMCDWIESEGKNRHSKHQV